MQTSTISTEENGHPHKWRSVTFLALAQVCALSLWFSATALIPALKAEFELSGFHASLFSSSVAVGFVIGTLISALLSLSDRYPPRLIFTISVLIAASSNGAILLFSPLSSEVIILRMITGIAMAGIYPVGMRMVATWARNDTGLLVGLLVGALTLGSASPHLLNILDIHWLDWRATLVGSSLLALAAAVLIQFVKLGHPIPKAPPFHFSLALHGWRDKAIRLANLGYFGHMWELYAMWAWIGIFVLESYRLYGLESSVLGANITTFLTIGMGALGSLFAGILADKLGRTTITIAAMLISGSCSIGIGFLFGGSPVLIVIICVIWGISIVADSAQFSTCIIELSPPNIIGTMLTIQTCAGFLISLLTIHLIPYAVTLVGWEYAFAFLAIGPFLGAAAMWRLRSHPNAHLLAGGKK
ncbi:MAG: MFS transporter [Sneathiella sp.]